MHEQFLPIDIANYIVPKDCVKYGLGFKRQLRSPDVLNIRAAVST